MPTYDYECQDCSHTFEKFQSITARPVRKCPRCGGRVKRLIGTGAGIIFKGSGFYETDYKRKRTDGAPESGESKTDAAKSEGDTGGKDESPSPQNES
ncbi:MAG: FmdB family zinc ribbon protein [bacterium]